MALNKAALEKLMAPLRQRYLVQLREYSKEMQIIASHFDSGSVSPDDRDKLLQRAHSLSGTGSTYGFTAVTEAAQALETLLNAKEADSIKLMNCLEKLIAACHNAIGE